MFPTKLFPVVYVTKQSSVMWCDVIWRFCTPSGRKCVLLNSYTFCTCSNQKWFQSCSCSMPVIMYIISNPTRARETQKNNSASVSHTPLSRWLYFLCFTSVRGITNLSSRKLDHHKQEKMNKNKIVFKEISPNVNKFSNLHIFFHSFELFKIRNYESF